jgi:hypothetical protein
MLSPGGIIALDDWDWLPAVRSVTSFIENNLPYEVIPSPEAPKVRVLRKVVGPARAWDHFVPFEVGGTDRGKQLKSVPILSPVDEHRSSATTSNGGGSQIATIEIGVGN